MFTESQKKAINTKSPATLVVAGAGSGKTTVVVNRIAHLIRDRHVSPSSILVITFTNKAAKELKARIEKLGVRTPGIWIGTFHAISYKILMQFGEHIGYNTKELISVIDEHDKESILKEAKKLVLFDSSIRKYESKIMDLSANLKELAEDDYEYKRLFIEYCRILKANNAIDFDLMLLEVHTLFEKYPKAQEYYHNKFKYVFVDEYQDTNHIQYSLHEKIAPENLFCVGDPDQGIYSFRGANINIILDFKNQHKDCEIIKLQECFRCDKNIVMASNKLIEHNLDRLDKTLLPVKEETGLIEVLNDEKIDYAEIISEQLFMEPQEEIAIIARTHRALDFAQKRLEKLGLRYLRVKKIENKLKIIFKNFCRVIANVKDGIARLNLNNDIGAIGLEQINLNINDLFINLITFVTTRFKLPAEKIEILAKENEGLTIAQVLEKYRLEDMHSSLEKQQKGKITLLTAHAAKGLEWDNVFIIGCSAGYFPSKRAKDNGNLEEERRLMYVAMTRARKRLYISFYKKTSEFINELGEKNNGNI